MVQIFEEDSREVSVGEPHIAEAKGKVDVLVKLDQILDRQENGVQGVGDHVFTKAAGCSDWHGVRVDAPVALLEDGVLAG